MMQNTSTTLTSLMDRDRTRTVTTVTVPLPEGVAAITSGDVARLTATRAFAAGEPIFRLDHVNWESAPNANTVAYFNGRYFTDPVLAMVTDDLDANCRIWLEWMVVVACRDIMPGEMLTADLRHPRSSSSPCWMELRCG
jgi:hypothetical protein